MKKLSPQANTVLAHIRRGRYITPMDADGLYHIRSLSSRIDELRAAGYEIYKARLRSVTGRPYTSYSFTKRQQHNNAPVLPSRRVQKQYRVENFLNVYRQYCILVLGLDAVSANMEVDDFHAYLMEDAA